MLSPDGTSEPRILHGWVGLMGEFVGNLQNLTCNRADVKEIAEADPVS